MRHPRGFTLVELLVVIAIIGILVGLLLPAVQAAREAARRMQCSNNIKQLALASHNYHDTHKKFPIGQHLFGNTAGGISRGLGYNWSFGLLPFIEQTSLYNQFDNRFPVFEKTITRNGILAATPLATFSCPSDLKPPTIDLTTEAIRPTATSSYKAVNGAYNNGYSTLTANDQTAFNGTFERDSRAVYGMTNLTDGTSNTIIIAETRWGMNASKRTRTYIYGASDPTTTFAGGASECSFVNGQNRYELGGYRRHVQCESHGWQLSSRWSPVRFRRWLGAFHQREHRPYRLSLFCGRSLHAGFHCSSQHATVWYLSTPVCRG